MVMESSPETALGSRDLAEHIAQKQSESCKLAATLCSPGTPARSDALLLTQAVNDALAQKSPEEADTSAPGQAERTNLAFTKSVDTPHLPEREEHTTSSRPVDENGAREPAGLSEEGLDVESPSGPRLPQPLKACAVDDDLEEIRTELLKQRDNPRQRVLDTRRGKRLLPRNTEAMAAVAWGCAHNYQLGTGQYMAQDTPVVVSPLLNLGSALLDVSCGGDHGGAVDGEGRLYTWGLSDHGRLGLLSARDAPMPSAVRSLQEERVVAVTCGMYSTACIADNFRVFTWGAGGSGQLGHGEKQDEWVPRLVDGLQNHMVVQVAIGFRHSLALTADGRVLSWGEGEAGQLGHGDSATCLRPKEVALGAAVTGVEVGSVVLVGCGANFSALLTDRGRVLTTGSSEYGALGLGRVRKVAVPTVLTSKVLEKRFFAHLAVGEEHCAAVTSKGNVYTWGQGCFGAVGKAAASRLMHPPDCLRPHRLTLPDERRAEEVACGGNYTAIVLAGGEVVVLGDDDTTIRSAGGEGRVLHGQSVRCGRFHTIVLSDVSSASGLPRAGGWADGAGWVAQVVLAPLKAVMDVFSSREAGGRRKRRGRQAVLPQSLVGAAGLMV